MKWWYGMGVVSACGEGVAVTIRPPVRLPQWGHEGGWTGDVEVSRVSGDLERGIR